MIRPRHLQSPLWLALSLLAASGCGHRSSQSLLPVGPPDLRLEQIRLADPGAESYAVLARWAPGTSVRPIRHYLWAVDPRSIDAVDDTWVRTTETQRVLMFPRQRGGPGGAAPHVFVVRAVDEAGALSDPRWLTIAADNLPPVVEITQPRPSAISPAFVSPSVQIHWQGSDPDGQTTQQPVAYRYRLFAAQNPDFPAIPDFVEFARTDPDSFRRLYAPGFTGWDTAPPTTTSASYTNLVPGTRYLFAITAFDEAGDYDPVFSTNKNMLVMNVTFAGTAGPKLRMYNEYFDYTYPSGGWLNGASRTVTAEMPAGQPLTLNWHGTPGQGSSVRWYRWALGSVDLLDETPRVNEATDLQRWSVRSLATSATIGPFTPPPGRSLSRLFYIEVEDSNGLRSLGIVDIVVRRPPS